MNAGTKEMPDNTTIEAQIQTIETELIGLRKKLADAQRIESDAAAVYQQDIRRAAVDEIEDADRSRLDAATRKVQGLLVLIGERQSSLEPLYGQQAEEAREAARRREEPMGDAFIAEYKRVADKLDAKRREVQQLEAAVQAAWAAPRRYHWLNETSGRRCCSAIDEYSRALVVKGQRQN